MAPDLEDDDSLPDSDDGWVLTSVWSPPERVKKEDLLGDELKVVACELEAFDELPEMKEPYLQCSGQEVLEIL